VRVLYGVASEGIGHAVTSSVVRDHLVRSGHTVTFACAKGTRACGHLAKYGDPVISVSGLTLAQDHSGRTNHLKTIGINLVAGAKMLIEPILLATLPRPDVIITDFEPVVAIYANMLGLPLIAINNLHFADRCSHPKSIVGPYRKLAAISIPAGANVVPDASHYFVPTFVKAPIRKSKTSLHFPILEPMPKSDQGSYVLVYFNDKAPWGSIIGALQACAPMRFRCYGSGREGTEKNVTLCPPSDEFVDDFACSGAVIGGAGFTLVARSIYSQKPMLAVPFGDHFEQILNSSYLESLGYGMCCGELTPDAIQSFLQRTPNFAAKLSVVKHDQNAELFNSLDRMLGY
jgi:uncharacterized protein (TIGR00661 family)